MTQKMMKQKKLIFSWILAFAMVVGIISPGSAVAVKADNTPVYKTQLTGATKYIKGQIAKPAYGDEWYVIQQSRSGNEDVSYYKAYYDSVVSQISDSTKAAEMKPLDWARVIIALESIGADPTDVNGKNLFENLADFTKLDKGSIYDIYTTTYVLIALQGGTYEIPSVSGVAEANKTTKEKLVNSILNCGYDEEKGCWGGPDWNSPYEWKADPDMAGIAIQALAPYYSGNNEVKKKIDSALNCLSNLQDNNGCFDSYGSVNACSTAQVLLALIELGINPDKDSRFKKNKTIVEGLADYYDGSTGGFKNYIGGDVDLGFATVQVSSALTSYDRLLNKKTSLYDMSDVDYKLYTKLTLSKPSIKKVTSPKKKQIKVTWKKIKGVTGYEIQASTSKNFKKSKTKTFKVKKGTATNTTLKKSLKSRRRYYVRMRTYKTTISGKTVKSKWSAKKKITTK